MLRSSIQHIFSFVLQCVMITIACTYLVVLIKTMMIILNIQQTDFTLFQVLERVHCITTLLSSSAVTMRQVPTAHIFQMRLREGQWFTLMFSRLLNLNPVLLFLAPVLLTPASFCLLRSLDLIPASHRGLCTSQLYCPLRPRSQLHLWAKYTSCNYLLLICLLGPCCSNTVFERTLLRISPEGGKKKNMEIILIHTPV